MYARIVDGKVIEWPIYSLSERFPDTSFPSPMRNEDVPEGYVLLVELSPPEHTLYQKVVQTYPKLINGIWTLGWDIVDLSEEERTKSITDFNNIQEVSRSIAYKTEADPLFFKWQRGEATQENWLAKIQEIKQRFPDIQ